MKIKLKYCLLLAVLTVIFLIPAFASAQDDPTAVFNKYTNPHAVCDWYRSQGVVIERVSDNECLTSLGTGELKTYTQFYYSGNQWCFKLIQKGQTYHSNCVPIPSSSTTDSTPYIVAGAVIFGVIIVGAISSAGAKAKAPVKSGKGSYGWEETETTTTETVQQPEPAQEESNIDNDTEDDKQLKPKRSGKGSYGWEEMETTTTESGVESIQGPPEGESTGGIGLHQGEPIVSSTANELERLVKLKNDGVISNKEFNIAKKKLLK